jgi:drug/metabolite transporter (DMT)-like permease
MLRERRVGPDHIGEIEMNGNQIIGLLLVAVGLFLLVFGYNASQAPLDQVSEAFTGKFRDSTMLYLLGGVVAVVAGGALAMLGRRA